MAQVRNEKKLQDLDARAGQRHRKEQHGDDTVHKSMGIDQDRPLDIVVAVLSVQHRRKVCNGKLDAPPSTAFQNSRIVTTLDTANKSRTPVTPTLGM